MMRMQEDAVSLEDLHLFTLHLISEEPPERSPKQDS